MTEISASLVKSLRESTGVGMMDCKKALTETNGYIELAKEWLRKKGLSNASGICIMLYRPRANIMLRP